MDSKKHETHRKHKKSKSKRRETSSESGSESDTVEWVEAKPAKPKVEHDEWMDDDSFVPTYSKSSMLRKSKKQMKNEETILREKKILEQRELNPYWRNDGSGLPESSECSSSNIKSSTSSVGDGGYSWLKKAYQRVKEQAQKEGRSMEEVAAERWGSLGELEAKLSEASKCVPGHSKRSPSPDYRSRKRMSKLHDDDGDREESNYYKKRESYHHSKPYSERTDRRDRFSDSKFQTPRDKDGFHSQKVSSTSQSSMSQSRPSWKKKEFVKQYETGENLSSKKIEYSDSTKSSSFPDSSSGTMTSRDGNSNAFEAEKRSLSSEDEEDAPDELRESPILNQNELNYLASRVLRAKITGDLGLAARIEKDLFLAKEQRKDIEKSGERIEDGHVRELVLTHKVDIYPLPRSFQSCHLWKKRRNKRNVYVTAMTTRHYDDKEQSVQQLFEREKATTVGDQMKMYFSAAASSKDALIEGCEDDISGKMAKRMDQNPSQEKDMQKFIHGYKKMDIAMDRCRFCLDKKNLPKHTIVAKGNKVFLCVPSCKSLVDGHCFIVPTSHVVSTLHLDEDEYCELQVYKRGLLEMFREKGQSFVFMETSFKHHTYPHAFIECIPMPSETADMAPLYFKKAIDESEYEWADNKKLVDLSKKSVRKSIPKELPFFCVEFGMGGGFAHIIEDERQFPNYFGKEIVGGMLEIDSHEIVKDRPEDWKQICDKVLKFVNHWCRFKDYFSC